MCEHDVSNCTRKCKIISYGVNNNDVLNCNGKEVNSEKKGVHLGHIVGPSVNMHAT